MATNNWELDFCAGYIVPPCKDCTSDEAYECIQGSEMNLSAKVRDYFYPIFDSSVENCTVGIVFPPLFDPNPSPIPDLLRTIAYGKTRQDSIGAAQDLACGLALASDDRSPTGLFVIMTGVRNGITRIVLFKFPADDTLQATFSREGLSINVVEGAFSISRKTDYYKAAAFEGRGAKNSFATGKVEDRQANQAVHEVSQLWVFRFLQAVPDLTDKAGTKILARNLRKLLQESDSKFHHAIIAASTALSSQNDRNITMKEIENYLPPELRQKFMKHLDSPLLQNAVFKIDLETLSQELGIRVIELDTLFTISAPIEQFNNQRVYSEKNGSEESSLEFTIRGQIIRERLKSRKQ